MASSENAVREAAAKLHEAVIVAEAEGYHVAWPLTAAGLPTIAVSETAKMNRPAAAPGKQTAKPATTGL